MVITSTVVAHQMYPQLLLSYRCLPLSNAPWDILIYICNRTICVALVLLGCWDLFSSGRCCFVFTRSRACAMSVLGRILHWTHKVRDYSLTLSQWLATVSHLLVYILNLLLGHRSVGVVCKNTKRPVANSLIDFSVKVMGNIPQLNTHSQYMYMVFNLCCQVTPG